MESLLWSWIWLLAKSNLMAPSSTKVNSNFTNFLGKPSYCRVSEESCLLGYDATWIDVFILDYPKDGNSNLLQDVTSYLSANMVSYLKTHESSFLNMIQEQFFFYYAL
jgi:hypothetical protein